MIGKLSAFAALSYASEMDVESTAILLRRLQHDDVFCPPIPDVHGPACTNLLSPHVLTDKTEKECKDLCRANPRCKYALTGPEWCQNCEYRPFPTKPTLPGSKQAFLHPKRQFAPNFQCPTTYAPTPAPTPQPTIDVFCPPITDVHGPWCWNMLSPPVATDKTETECKDLCRENPECQYALTGPGWCQNCKHSPFPIKATLPGSLQTFMHPKKEFSPNGQCQESPFCPRIPDVHGPACSNLLSPHVLTDKTETECKALCRDNPRCKYALTGPEWCQNCAYSPFPTKPTLPGSKQAFMHPKKQFAPNFECPVVWEREDYRWCAEGNDQDFSTATSSLPSWALDDRVGHGWRWCGVTVDECKELSEGIDGVIGFYRTANGCCFPMKKACFGASCPGRCDANSGTYLIK